MVYGMSDSAAFLDILFTCCLRYQLLRDSLNLEVGTMQLKIMNMRHWNSHTWLINNDGLATWYKLSVCMTVGFEPFLAQAGNNAASPKTPEWSSCTVVSQRCNIASLLLLPLSLSSCSSPPSSPSSSPSSPPLPPPDASSMSAQQCHSVTYICNKSMRPMQAATELEALSEHSIVVPDTFLMQDLQILERPKAATVTSAVLSGILTGTTSLREYEVSATILSTLFRSSRNKISNHSSTNLMAQDTRYACHLVLKVLDWESYIYTRNVFYQGVPTSPTS